MRLIRSFKLIADAIAQERATGKAQQSEIDALKTAVAALQSANETEKQQLQNAIETLESKLDYTPVVDKLAQEIKKEVSDTYKAALEDGAIADPSKVTPAEVAETVLETMMTEAASEDGVKISDSEIAEVKDAAVADVDPEMTNN